MCASATQSEAQSDSLKLKWIDHCVLCVCVCEREGESVSVCGHESPTERGSSAVSSCQVLGLSLCLSLSLFAAPAVPQPPSLSYSPFPFLPSNSGRLGLRSRWRRCSLSTSMLTRDKEIWHTTNTSTPPASPTRLGAKHVTNTYIYAHTYAVNK